MSDTPQNDDCSIKARRNEIVKRLQGKFTSRRKELKLVDDLIAERRREAMKENVANDRP
jgi:hypothetical protein